MAGVSDLSGTSQVWPLLLSMGIAIFLALTLLRYIDFQLNGRDRNQSIKKGDQEYLRRNLSRPPLVKYRWPLALELVFAAIEAESNGDLLGWFQTMFRKTGNTMEHYLLGTYAVDTIDPQCIQAILKTQFDEFSLGDRDLQFGPLLGDGIFTQEGEAWRTSRALLRPQFMQTRSRSFPFIQDGVEEFLRQVQLSKQENVTINLQPLLFQLTMNTSLAILCGHAPKESTDNKLQIRFAEAFDYAQSQLKLRSRAGPLYWIIDGPKFRHSCRNVRSFAESVVRKALNQEQSNSPKDPDRYVFLEGMITATRDPKVLTDHLVNILLAGRDTTACLLSWTVKLLARHQDIQSELRQKCLELPSYQSGELPSVAEVRNMRFLNNVLSETLRLYPSVPVNVRVATKETTLPLGGGPDTKSTITLGQGEAVGYSLYSMHRLPDIWGEDSEDFRPSRWTDELKQRTQHAYAPFSSGPRTCPGQDFALLEAGYTMIRLLQTFSTIQELPSEPERFRHATTLVVAPKDGCWVKLN